MADWLTAPDTQFLLDFVRPDFLRLRVKLTFVTAAYIYVATVSIRCKNVLQVLARGLVMWNEIEPTYAWIESNIPEVYIKQEFIHCIYSSLYWLTVYCNF